MKGWSVSRSTSCLSRPPSHWLYLFETCHFPEPSQCASLDHQLLPSQFDSGDSSISGPSNFVLFSFFHFIRRFWNHILICLSVKQSACAISILLLPLHPPVLEPYFDLSLCQTECVRYLDSPPASEIPIEVKLLLELEGLVAGVRLSASLPLKLAAHPRVERGRQGSLGSRLLGGCPAVCMRLRRRMALAPHVGRMGSLGPCPKVPTPGSSLRPRGLRTRCIRGTRGGIMGGLLS